MPITKRNQQPTSIYLNAQDRAALETIRQQTGMGPTAILRAALHQYAATLSTRRPAVAQRREN